MQSMYSQYRHAISLNNDYHACLSIYTCTVAWVSWEVGFPRLNKIPIPIPIPIGGHVNNFSVARFLHAEWIRELRTLAKYIPNQYQSLQSVHVQSTLGCCPMSHYTTCKNVI